MIRQFHLASVNLLQLLFQFTSTAEIFSRMSTHQSGYVIFFCSFFTKVVVFRKIPSFEKSHTSISLRAQNRLYKPFTKILSLFMRVYRTESLLRLKMWSRILIVFALFCLFHVCVPQQAGKLLLVRGAQR